MYVAASSEGYFDGPEPSRLWPSSVNFDPTKEPTMFARVAHLFLPFDKILSSFRTKALHRRRKSRLGSVIADKEETETEGIPYNSSTLYLEYYPLGRLSLSLLNDVNPIRWASFLSLKLQLLWMGGGDDPKNTPLHYDKFENFMVMVAGKKTFRMFDPGQSALVYGDELSPIGIIGAELILNESTGVEEIRYTRDEADITEAVYTTYTMLDPHHPDYNRYPLFKQAKQTVCSISKVCILRYTATPLS
jgi:hypothetical protein